jgi:DNA polymerase III delta prime subunit
LDDAARLQDHLSLSPGPGVRARVVVIVDADQLNPQAANRLLKTLEEPPPRTAILMSTSRLHAMLPTVLSRCIKWRLSPPPVHESQKWLFDRTQEERRDANITPEIIVQALKSSGLAPGKAWQSLQSPDLRTLDLIRQMATALARPERSPAEALKQAEMWSKGSNLTLPELTELYERGLNETYWQWSEADGQPRPLVRSVVERREHLRVLKRLSRKGRVLLHAQLAMEALAFNTKL